MNEKMTLSDWLIGQSVEHFFLIKEFCGRAMTTMGFKRKQNEQAMGRNLVGDTLPWPLFQFLPPGSCLNFMF